MKINSHWTHHLSLNLVIFLALFFGRFVTSGWSMATSSVSSSSSSSSQNSNKRLKVDAFNAVDRRLPTIRSVSSTSSSSLSAKELNKCTKERVQKILQHAKDGTPFTEEEVQDIVCSIQNMVPKQYKSKIDFKALKELLKESAHLSHKNWDITSDNAQKLSQILSVSPSDSSITTTSNTNNDSSDDDLIQSLSPHAKQLFERILKEGNWRGALHSASTEKHEPWAVLVTGVNGIRKTTSMYQPWFGELLSEALCTPASDKNSNVIIQPEDLPTGSNSFFRQLDHMICTLTNEEFFKLYQWAASQLPNDGPTKGTPSEQVVNDYSDYKAAIFSRYRTISELLGGLLLREAQKVNINCLMETSGKDVAMFHYVDHFFDSQDKDSVKYKKLALHFTVNNLECAKTSVDRRMIQEIQDGIKAVESGDAFDIVYANAGGPYGSQVLEGVQKDSDSVWESEVLSGNVGSDWYKATIAINAHDAEPWTAQAVKPDGSLGTEFAFERR